MAVRLLSSDLELLSVAMRLLLPDLRLLSVAVRLLLHNWGLLPPNLQVASNVSLYGVCCQLGSRPYAAQRSLLEAGSLCTFWSVIESKVFYHSVVIECVGFVDEQEQEPAGEAEKLRILLVDLEKELRENMVVPADHCLISPWLQTTHWHKYICGNKEGGW